MTKISGIGTTETDITDVDYVEGERGDGTSVKIPPDLIGGRILLDTKAGTGSSATISFTSIPADYHELLIHLSGRSTVASATDSVYVQANGDTGNNYSRQIDWSNNSTPTAYGTSGSPSGYPGYMPGNSAASNAYGSLILRVPFYTKAARKAISTNIFFAYNNAANATYRMDGTTGWHSTAAINRLDLFLSGGNWTADTEARLYGIV